MGLRGHSRDRSTSIAVRVAMLACMARLPLTESTPIRVITVTSPEFGNWSSASAQADTRLASAGAAAIDGSRANATAASDVELSAHRRVQASTTFGINCDVPTGLAAPANGALDSKCAPGAELGSGESCALTCNPGFALSGTQPSCSARLGDFVAGSIVCSAMVCTQPASTVGYLTDESNLDLSRGAFDVSGQCAPHYEGTLTATPCAASGPYTLSGCAPVICTRPINTVVAAYDPVETQLNTAEGFAVTGSCATGYSGTFAASACATSGQPYSLSGCDQCVPQPGCISPGNQCLAGTNELVCNPGGGSGGYFVDQSGRVVACSPGTQAQAHHQSTSGCTQCAVGHYQENPQQTTCIGCGPGKYVGAEGSSSSSACADCAPGSVTNMLAGMGASTCTRCAAGQFSTDSTISCIDCPAGTYVETTGSSAEDDCTLCGVGMYSEVPGSPSQNNCIACRAGTFLSGDVSLGVDQTSGHAMGGDQASDCRPCPDSTFSAITGLGHADDCIPCPCQSVADRGSVCSQPNSDSTGCTINEVLDGRLEWTPVQSGVEVELSDFVGPMQLHCNPQGFCHRLC